MTEASGVNGRLTANLTKALQAVGMATEGRRSMGAGEGGVAVQEAEIALEKWRRASRDPERTSFAGRLVDESMGQRD